MRTLVLNAGYEPLAVVSFKRALILVLNEKATILAGAEKGMVAARLMPARVGAQGSGNWATVRPCFDWRPP